MASEQTLRVLYKVGEKFDALAQMARDYKNYDEKTFTVKTLLTHTFRWTVQAMGFQRLWVGGGEKKISAQES